MTTPKKKIAARKQSSKSASSKCSFSFQAANIESLFPVLDALAWLDLPDAKQVAQFAGIDPRTAGKLLKNCLSIGVAQTAAEDGYALMTPYPFKGDIEQKKAVIREALVRMPLLQHIRQFLNLGDSLKDAVRKAATLDGVSNYDAQAFGPLLKWAKQIEVLEPDLLVEDIADNAVLQKEERHKTDASKVVAFLSHSSSDKPFVRQLAADLTKNGVSVWLDEREIGVGDSITEKVGQGLAESDYFLIALSDNSVNSAWVQKELNQALVTEIEKRQVHILPLKLSDCEIPTLIKDKKYADFSTNYKQGLGDLVNALQQKD
ncbi:MAG: hypothetical protein SynsKO_30380 [Synoicihabitans sp.]